MECLCVNTNTSKLNVTHWQYYFFLSFLIHIQPYFSWMSTVYRNNLFKGQKYGMIVSSPYPHMPYNYTLTTIFSNVPIWTNFKNIEYIKICQYATSKTILKQYTLYYWTPSSQIHLNPIILLLIFLLLLLGFLWGVFVKDL